MKTILAVLLGVSAATPAMAQYYAPPPPPGYYAPPPRPGYYAPPGYYRPPRMGGRCDAVFPSRYGPQRTICPIVERKPLGAPCACPPPRGYPPGPYFGGRTVR